MDRRSDESRVQVRKKEVRKSERECVYVCVSETNGIVNEKGCSTVMKPI